MKTKQNKPVIKTRTAAAAGDELIVVYQLFENRKKNSGQKKVRMIFFCFVLYSKKKNFQGLEIPMLKLSQTNMQFERLG